MTRLRGQTTTWALLGTFAVAAFVAGTVRPVEAQDVARRKADDGGAGWQAVAPGVVEPGSGEIKIFAPVVGRIAEVPIAANDKVAAGEPLLRFDDEEAQARVARARAQVAIRERVRNEQSGGRGENRRISEDEVASAETAVVEARAAFDAAALAKRAGGSDAAMMTARTAWTRAQENLVRQRARLRKLETESGTPLPTQKEGELEVARSELRLSIAELEKLIIRAPLASTILEVNAKAGETAVATGSQPLVLLGDLSRLRVRAELDEHDVGKIAVGDKVLVHADAFRGREFGGRVAKISPIVRLGRISSPDSRDLSDFRVNEVLIDLDDAGPLLVGMKVDAFFLPTDRPK